MADLAILKNDSLGIWIEPYVTSKAGMETLSIPQTTDSKLVSEAKSNIFSVLPMDSMVKNLINSGDLMFLAFNAAAGTELWSAVAKVQFSLSDLAGKVVNILAIYQLQCEEVMKALVKIYRYLLLGKEELAVIQLKFCANVATQMIDYANSLGAGFEDLYNQSYSVSRSALNLRNLSNAERENLTQELNGFNERQTKAKAYRDQLLRDIDNVTRDHCATIANIQSSGGGFSDFIAGFLGIFGIQVYDPRKELLAQENTRFSQQMQQLQQQNLDNLREISRNTEQIANLKSGISDATRDVETFHTVNRALSILEVSLKQETLFWSAMKSYCNQLSSFKNLQPQASISPEKKIENYSSARFANLFLKGLSQWMAIYTISREGLDAAKIMKGKIENNIQAPASIATARSITPGLAQRVLGSVNLQIEALEAAKGAKA